MKNKSNIFSVPTRNYFYCLQDNDINGFNILNHEKKPVYYSIGKVVATRSHYRVNRKIDDVAIASIDQDQQSNKYHISDETGTTLARIQINEAETIQLKIGGDKYSTSIKNRTKQFEVTDKNGNLVMTIDKKLISLNDQYKVAFVEDFPALIAALLPIIIDDFFHLGTTN